MQRPLAWIIIWVQALGEHYSRSQIIASVKSGDVLVDEKNVKPGFRLKTGHLVSGCILITEQGGRPEPQPVPFEVVLEDPSFIVVNKPAGLVVHPGNGNRDGTLVNGLLYRYLDIGGVGDPERPGIVHRLDKDTSGILLIARTAEAHRKLARQFKNRLVSKHYLAIVHGVPDVEKGRIVASIGRHPVQRQKMAVRHSDGRYAASNWKVVSAFERHALLKVDIETGRTHQIRVHLAHIGHPVVGDRVYGSNRNNEPFSRQMLHAWKLSFIHPDDEASVSVKANIPIDFMNSLDDLEAGKC